MTAGAGQSDDKVKLMVDAWKTAVDVQKHFNDLEMRIRSFAISFLGVVLGASAVAVQQLRHSYLSTILAGAGLVAWLGFYLMDGLWYHRLLVGSVKQGELVESALEAETGLSVFNLTKKISAESPITVRGTQVKARHKLAIFYVGGGLGLAFMVVITLLLRAQKSEAAPPETLHVILSPDSAWVASHPTLPPLVADSLVACCCRCRRRCDRE